MRTEVARYADREDFVRAKGWLGREHVVMARLCTTMLCGQRLLGQTDVVRARVVHDTVLWAKGWLCRKDVVRTGIVHDDAVRAKVARTEIMCALAVC